MKKILQAWVALRAGVAQRRKPLLWLLLLSGIGLTAFALLRQKPGQQIDAERYVVQVDDLEGEYFLTTEDVTQAIRNLQAENSLFDDKGKADLEMLERRLSQELGFARDVQVSRDLRGNVVVDVEQQEPIARLLTPSGKTRYLSRDGKLLRISPHHTARVLLITGPGSERMCSQKYWQQPEGQELFGFLGYLYDHPLWKVQVVELAVDQQRELQAYTLAGNQCFELGTAEGYREKMAKMKIFYEKIVPEKGWNVYKVVKLQYQNQIVCK